MQTTPHGIARGGARAGLHDNPGQALRGSSEFHAWGDSNLYVQRVRDRLRLSAEHRAAPSLPAFGLRLHAEGDALGLIAEEASSHDTEPPPAPKTIERIHTALAKADAPMHFRALREACRIRAHTLTQTLRELEAESTVRVVDVDATGLRVELEHGRVTARVRAGSTPLGLSSRGRAIYADDADFTVAVDDEGGLALQPDRGSVRVEGFGSGDSVVGAGTRLASLPGRDAVLAAVPLELLLEVSWPGRETTRQSEIVIDGRTSANESRIETLCFVYFLVLVVQALVERELRRAMDSVGIDDLPLYGEGRPGNCREMLGEKSGK